MLNTPSLPHLIFLSQTTPNTWNPGRPATIQDNDDDDDLAKLAKGLGQDSQQPPLYNPADDRDERSTIDEFFFTHDDQFGNEDAPLGEGIVTDSTTMAKAGAGVAASSRKQEDDDPRSRSSYRDGKGGNGGSSTGNGTGTNGIGSGSGHRESPPLGGAWGRPMTRKWEPNLGFPAFAPDNASYGGGAGDRHAASPGLNHSNSSSSSDQYLNRRPRSPIEGGVDKAWEVRSGSRSPSPRRHTAAAASPPGSPNSSQDLTGMLAATASSRSSPTTGISARTRGSYSSSDLNSSSRHYHSQNYGTRFTARRSLSSALESKSATTRSRHRTAASSEASGDQHSSHDSRLAVRRRNLARRQRGKTSQQESSPRRAVELADADEPVTAEDMVVALEDYR